MKNFILPCIYGVSLYDGNNKISCIVDRSGKFNVEQKKYIINLNPYKILFLRGIFYFFASIIFMLKGLFDFLEKYKNPELKTVRKAKKSLNVSTSSIITFLIIAISLFGSIFLFGIIPLKLSYILGVNLNIFLKRLITCIIKCVFLYLILIVLKYIPSVAQYYKFNSAVSEDDEKNNVLLYIFSIIFFNLFNLSLFGMVSSSWYFFVVNIGLLLLFISLGYELYNLFIKNKYLKHIFDPINFLICQKPSANEMRCVKIVLNEKILSSNKRDKMESKLGENSISMSEAYILAKEILEKANKFEKSDLDFIFCEVLGKSRAEFKLLKEITKADYKKILKFAQRRAQGEPISKIFQHTNFYGLDFVVTKDVLSPRMDTERLVEETLKFCGEKTKVLDIGTGSGAVAVSLAKFSKSRVLAVDISEDALKVAKQNANQNNVKIVFKKSDIFSAIKREKFDIIVSNPPYIPSADISNLDDEVKRFDPLEALDGGDDGLEFYRKIIDEAPLKLSKNGKLLFEIGIGQAKEVKNLLQKNFKDIRIIKDYNKIDRVIVATLK